MEETEVGPIVFDGDQIFDVLVGKVLQHQRDIVGVKKELGQIFELEDMGYLEPLQQEEQRTRDGSMTTFS